MAAVENAFNLRVFEAKLVSVALKRLIIRCADESRFVTTQNGV
jgi:hypothetical protein